MLGWEKREEGKGRGREGEGGEGEGEGGRKGGGEGGRERRGRGGRGREEGRERGRERRGEGSKIHKIYIHMPTHDAGTCDQCIIHSACRVLLSSPTHIHIGLLSVMTNHWD